MFIRIIHVDKLMTQKVWHVGKKIKEIVTAYAEK